MIKLDKKYKIENNIAIIEKVYTKLDITPFGNICAIKVIKNIATQSIVKYIQNDITISFNLFTKTLLCLLFTTLLKSIPVAVLIPIENSTVIAVKNTFKESKVTSLCEAIPSF